jgi:hypothetical protein
MNVKHIVAATAVALGCAYSSHAMLGVPVGELPFNEAGLIRLGASLALGGEWQLYGARVTWGPTEGMSFTLGGGLASLDHRNVPFDTAPYFQIGGKYMLPLEDLPVDLAIIGSFGMAQFEKSVSVSERVGSTEYNWGQKAELDAWAFNLGCLASYEFDFGLTAYAHVGLSYQNYDISASYSGDYYYRSYERNVVGKVGDGDVNPFVGVGAFYPLNERFSVFAEAMVLQEGYFGIGALFDF